MSDYIPFTKSSRFFIYELRRPDGWPFYVGKGTDAKRPRRHVLNARRGIDAGNSYKGNIIRKIEREGGVVEIAVVFETDDERIAFAEEIRRIAYYRANGVELANITDGGDGMTGPKSAEHRAKIGAAHKGRPRTDRQRSAVAEANRHREHAAKTREKLGARTQKRVEQLNSLHAQNIGKKQCPETRAKKSESLRRYWAEKRAADEVETA